MQREPKPHRRTAVNLLIDSAIFVAFLVATAPQFSGVAIHEWLGIAFGVAIVTHLLLHWHWIVGVTRYLFSRASHESRLNYGLNALLFIDVTIITFTGLMISEAALPLFGVRFPRDGFWMLLHRLASDLGVFLIALHVGLHWRWIANAVRRTAALPTRGRAAPRPGLAANRAPEEAH